jgi:hypothetical protein
MDVGVDRLGTEELRRSRSWVEQRGLWSIESDGLRWPMRCVMDVRLDLGIIRTQRSLGTANDSE